MSEGNWKTRKVACTNRETGESQIFISCEPNFGPAHDPHPGCFCQPTVEDDVIVIHNVIH